MLSLSTFSAIWKLSAFIACFRTATVCLPLLFLGCAEKPTLRVESIEPPELLLGSGRLYTLKGAGFSNSTRIYLNIRVFCGSNPRTAPDYGPESVAEDGTWLKVFIRPYEQLAHENVALTVIDGKRESTLSKVPVYSYYGEIRRLVKSFTLKELIGQTLMVGFDALEDDVQISNQGLIEIIREFKIGNTIIFKHNLPRVTDFPDKPLAIPRWLARLTNDLQETASDSQVTGKKIPLIIAVDQEGGSGNVLRGPGFTQVPEHTFIGITRKPQLAREAGRAVGTELRYLGVNANLAPIADIVTTSYDRIIKLNHYPTIGIRAFGAHKNIVSEMSVQYMKGLQDGGGLAIAKHFPGHGTSLENPHEVLPNIGLETNDELMSTSMAPFELLIGSGVNGLLTSHIKVPPWDKHPVTFSRKIIEEKLRNDLGFGGLVVSDDMSTMIGILKSEPYPARPTGRELYSRLEAISLAHEAGHDIVILGHIYPDEKLREKRWANIQRKKPIMRSQLQEIVDELMSLYRDEKELERLRDRVTRILFKKAVLYGFENFKNPASWRIEYVKEEYEELLAFHRRIADQILRESVVLLSEAGQVWDTQERFRYFYDGEGPLSQSSPLVSGGDRIALASPVHNKPDELLEAISAKAKWLGKIETVRMIYGFFTKDAKKQARKEWPGEKIEILRLLDPRGDFIFREEDVKRDNFPSPEDEPNIEKRIKQLKEIARVVDHAIDEKVEQIIASAKGKKVLVFAVVTRPQIEILDRIHARLAEDLPTTHVIVLLFKEPFLIPRSIYQHSRITVLHLSAFPDLTMAADVLLGQISPKPAQYSALNAPRTPIAITGGADMQPYPVKDMHQPKGEVDRKGRATAPILLTLLAGLLGGLSFYAVPRGNLRWSTSGTQYSIKDLLWSVAVGSVIALGLHFLFPFIERIEKAGISLRLGHGPVRFIVAFIIAFLANAGWVKFFGGSPRSPSQDSLSRPRK